MLERPQGGESVVLVHVDFVSQAMQEALDELKQLALTAGANIVSTVTAARFAPEAKYFVGTGKATEIKQVVDLHQADLVIFNHSLSPGQERNLERLFKCRVIDRSGLILDIFAQRARTFEGKLQVELAQLKHLSTRLIRGWTHLERQKGGIGLRGPGETQLESDRRMIRQRIKSIQKRLEKVHQQRSQSRQARKKAHIPTVALVGYTNAGKSTLFNTLCKASIYVADQLFATLDPTFRRVTIPHFGPVILADTVGFIRHLPHELIEAFKGTLEEVAEADLLLHVVDAYAETRRGNIQQVMEVLEQIGALDVPQILVMNKIDLFSDAAPKIEKNHSGDVTQVSISASTEKGLDLLCESIAHTLSRGMVQKRIVLTPNQGKLRATLYEHGAVLSEKISENGDSILLIRLPKDLYDAWFD